MPPAEPIAEQILDAVVTRLSGITANSTYWFTPGEVERDWKNFNEVRAFPYYGVIEGQQQPARKSYTQVEEVLSVIIIGWIKDTENRRRAVRRAIGDVKKAIFTDDTWGGLALATDPPSVETDEASLVAKPYAYFELTAPIRYLRAEGAV